MMVMTMIGGPSLKLLKVHLSGFIPCLTTLISVTMGSDDDTIIIILDAKVNCTFVSFLSLFTYILLLYRRAFLLCTHKSDAVTVAK